MWSDIPGTNKQYLHSFHKKQPDLNWENPAVREEIYKNINWWLDKGLGGFRIDAIINIKKAHPFESYQPDREDGLCSIQEMLSHANGVGEFLSEMRDRCFKPHDAFTVGEVFDEKPEELEDFIGENGYFSSKFDFNETVFGKSELGWYDAREITPEDYKHCCFDAQRHVGTSGFLSNIIENHDEPRGVSHYIPAGECTMEAKKMLGGLNFMLRGIPFLYQGQEIGMENTVFSSIDEVDDIATLDQYKTALEAGYTPEEALGIVSRYSRDNARTPMQWEATANAGFTEGTPWLKVNPNYKDINVADQISRDDSVFMFYKRLIQLRKDPRWKETIVYGTLEPVLEGEKNIMAYYRKGPKTLLIIGNFQKDAQEAILPCVPKSVLINNGPEVCLDQNKITLKGWQFLVLEI